MFWRAEATSDFTENHVEIVKLIAFCNVIHTAQQSFLIQRNPADIKKKDSFLCFQGLLVSHILLPLPGPAFGGLLSILGTSLTVSMVTEFSHA